MHPDQPQALLPQRYLTPNDLAALLGVPVQPIYQWRYKGVGPAGFVSGATYAMTRKPCADGSTPWAAERPEL